MKPHCLVVDDFLDDFQEAREVLKTLEFGEQQNVADGYSYPSTVVLAGDGEMPDVPFIREVVHKLQLIIGSRIDLRLLVARKSPEGVSAPEQAHCDMAIVQPSPTFTAILYMNYEEDCLGGTSLLRHVITGEDSGDGANDWLADKNKPHMWQRKMMVEMRENRIAIFPSRLIHRSEPIGGFGEAGSISERLVLVALFDIVA